MRPDADVMPSSYASPRRADTVYRQLAPRKRGSSSQLEIEARINTSITIYGDYGNNDGVHGLQYCDSITQSRHRHLLRRGSANPKRVLSIQ